MLVFSPPLARFVSCARTPPADDSPAQSASAPGCKSSPETLRSKSWLLRDRGTRCGRLLILESLHEALRFGVVVSRCPPAPADTDAVVFELCRVVVRRI